MQKRIIFTSCLRMFWPSCTKYQQCCDCASEGFLWTPYIWVLTSNQKRKQFLVNLSTTTTANRQYFVLEYTFWEHWSHSSSSDKRKRRSENYQLLHLHILMQKEKWYLSPKGKLGAGPCLLIKIFITLKPQVGYYEYILNKTWNSISKDNAFICMFFIYKKHLL